MMEDESFHLPIIFNFGHVDDIIHSLSSRPCPLLSTTLLTGTSFEFRISTTGVGPAAHLPRPRVCGKPTIGKSQSAPPPLFKFCL